MQGQGKSSKKKHDVLRPVGTQGGSKEGQQDVQLRYNGEMSNLEHRAFVNNATGDALTLNC